jgi:porphobilinogen deaminase
VDVAADAETAHRVQAERAVVASIGGGCLAPIAAHHDGTTLTALIADPDGAWIERRTGEDPAALAAELAALAA